MTQRRLNFDQTVRDRIESLLARVDGVRRGSDMRHVHFDDKGEREAQRIAAADVDTHRVGSDVGKLLTKSRG